MAAWLPLAAVPLAQPPQPSYVLVQPPYPINVHWWKCYSGPIFDQYAKGNLSLKILHHPVLGSGSFGTVYKGTLTTQLPPASIHVDVAVKKLHASNLGTMEEFSKELNVLKKINTYHVVKLLDANENEKDPFLVVEFMPHGDLKRKLDNLRQQLNCVPTLGLIYRVMPYTKIARMMAEIADGMHYLEKHHIVHRDLAARNILLTADGTCKVADLGLGRNMYDKGYYCQQPNGVKPILWTAPEALEHNLFTSKSDVWSYGVVLYEMSTLGGTPPHYTKGLPVNPVTPDKMSHIMVACRTYDPKKRPSFYDILGTIVGTGLLTQDFFAVAFYDKQP